MKRRLTENLFLIYEGEILFLNTDIWDLVMICFKYLQSRELLKLKTLRFKVGFNGFIIPAASGIVDI